MNQKNTGNQIRNQREKKAWTQEHLAEASEISVRTIQRAEDGVFSAETLNAIAGALDTEIENLTRESSANQEESSLVPILYYQKLSTLKWLVDAFDFQILESHTSPDGQIMHAELRVGRRGRVMCGSPVPKAGLNTPLQLKGVNQALNVFVENVDAHFKRARRVKAEILSPLQNGYGHRRYQARDPEGHIWYFATPLDF